jgi:Fic family protein
MTDMLAYIHESNCIEGYDSKKADKLGIDAWAWLIKQKQLNKGVICKLQKQLTLFQDDLQPNWRGYYRDINVSVGGRVCPAWHIVPHLMENWLLDYGDPNKEFDPLVAHIALEHCHPWADGNGRTGRLILWWHQSKKGQPLTMYKNSEKYEIYYPLFR